MPLPVVVPVAKAALSTNSNFLAPYCASRRAQAERDRADHVLVRHYGQRQVLLHLKAPLCECHVSHQPYKKKNSFIWEENELCTVNEAAYYITFLAAQN